MSHAPSHWDTVDAVEEEEALEEDVEEAVVKPGHKKQAKSPKKARTEIHEPKQPRPPASSSRKSAVPKTGLGLDRQGKRPDGGAESRTADMLRESRPRQGHKQVGSSKA